MKLCQVVQRSESTYRSSHDDTMTVKIIEACKTDMGTSVPEMYQKDKVIALLHALPQGNPKVLHIEDQSDVLVFGDIHGQLDDLLAWFDKVGWPNENPTTLYLFLGDYVDRGDHSYECLMLLLSLRHVCDNLRLLRGNHETMAISRVYGLWEDVKQKVCNGNEDDADSLFTVIGKTIFADLPFVCILNKKYLCMHGGISHHMLRSDIHKFNTERLDDLGDPELDEGILSNTLWNDPYNGTDYKTGFIESERGVGNRYTAAVTLETLKYLNQNLRGLRLDTVLRAHQVATSGVGVDFQNIKEGRFTLEKTRSGTHAVVTIFSAPNYGGGSNTAGVLHILKDGREEVLSMSSRL